MEKANELVERGLVINDAFTVVLPLSMPSKRVTLSNVPPFVKDDFLVNMLSRYGKLVSPIKKTSLGNVSPLLKHVVSFRRYAYMVVKDNADLEVSFNFRVDDFDYMIYATTDKMRCYGCGKAGHLVRTCPDKGENVESDEVIRPQTSAEAMVEIRVPIAQPSATEDAERRSAAGTVVDKVLPETMRATPSTSHEQMENVVVLVEAEKQTSSPGGGIKTSEVVPEATRTEAVDSPSFKVPLKRKKTKDDCFLKVAKKGEINEVINEEEEESDEDSSDSSSVLSQTEYQFTGYDVHNIKQFLKITKNKRNVNVENYFPNTQLLLERSRSLMSEGCFTDREVYRLKKIVRKLSIDLSNNDSVENVNL